VGVEKVNALLFDRVRRRSQIPRASRMPQRHMHAFPALRGDLFRKVVWLAEIYDHRVKAVAVEPFHQLENQPLHASEFQIAGCLRDSNGLSQSMKTSAEIKANRTEQQRRGELCIRAFKREWPARGAPAIESRKAFLGSWRL